MKVVLSSVALTVLATALLSAQAAKSQWDGIYTDAQATRGGALYKENCAACHAADLSGSEIAPALTPSQLTGGRWKEQGLGELFELMRVTMPWNSPGGLSAQQNADILAFMLQHGKFPAGKTELAATVAALNSIRILAAKP